MKPTRAGATGTARLEFALTVIVLGVIGALALDRIAQVKLQAAQAQVQTTAAQQRAQAALHEARCAGTADSPDAASPSFEPRQRHDPPFTTHRAPPLNPLQPGPPDFPCPGIEPPSPLFPLPFPPQLSTQGTVP